MGGLIKHVAHAEQTWIGTMLERERTGDYQQSFVMGPDETLACADRSFRTDVQAEPARPGNGTASGASGGTGRRFRSRGFLGRLCVVQDASAIDPDDALTQTNG